MLAACSRDAMSARREHVDFVTKQAGGAKAGPGASPAEPDKGKDEDKEKAEAPPHPEDEGSLRRWEELLRSVDVNGGRLRSDYNVVGGCFVGG